MQIISDKIKTIFIFPLLISSFLYGQIERETRAVWLTTNFRLDWPPQSLDQEKQKQALVEIFDNIKSKNLNTVFFQAASNGTTLFKSSFDPFSSYITGDVDGTPSYDPLKLAIEHSHKRGMEIHAWINVLRCFAGTEMNVLKNPNHISQRKPEWVIEDLRDGQKSYWLDPGLPEVREYISSMIEEMVENYDVDGVHLDFIRYPGRNFEDEFSYNIYGHGLSRDDYRRKNISDLIELINKKIKAVKHFVKLGAAPIGVYKNINGMTAWEGFTEVYQDSRDWLKRGIVDYVAPQIYWGFNDNPRFGFVAKEWMENSFGRNIILGIGAYKPSVKPDMDQMIQYSRTLNASGVAFFRYENIKDENFNSFQYKTYPAAMSWLDGIYPDPPSNLKFKKNDSNPKWYGLNWNTAGTTAKDDSIRYYALYSLPSSNSQLLQDYLFDVIPADRSSITVAIEKPKRANYFFTLKSVSNLWNESVASSNVVEVKISQLTSLISEDDIISKPVLIKESEQKIKILLYAGRNETVEITGLKENAGKILLVESIPAGKNILSLESEISSFQSVKILFKSSGKDYELKL